MRGDLYPAPGGKPCQRFFAQISASVGVIATWQVAFRKTGLAPGLVSGEFLCNRRDPVGILLHRLNQLDILPEHLIDELGDFHAL